MKAEIKQEIKVEIKQEGFQQGLKEGEQKAKTELARQLLSLGNLTEVQIAQVTGLSLEQIKMLAVC